MVKSGELGHRAASRQFRLTARELLGKLDLLVLRILAAGESMQLRLA